MGYELRGSLPLSWCHRLLLQSERFKLLISGLLRSGFLAFRWVLFVSTFAFSSSSFAIGDPKVGGEGWSASCASCHGAPQPEGSLSAFSSQKKTLKLLSVYAKSGTAIAESVGIGSNAVSEPDSADGLATAGYVHGSMLGTTSEPTSLAMDIATYFSSLFVPVITTPAGMSYVSDATFSYQITGDYFVSSTEVDQSTVFAAEADGLKFSVSPSGLVTATMPSVPYPSNYIVTLKAANQSSQNEAGSTTFVLNVTPESTNFDSTIKTQVDFGHQLDSNVTRASDPLDIRSDSSNSFDITSKKVFPLSDHTNLTLSLSLGAEQFQSNKGLGRTSGGVQGEFKFRPSGEFGSPVWGLFAKYTKDDYVSVLRDGDRYSVGLSMHSPLTDRLDFFAAISRNVRNGKSAVFNTQDVSAHVNLDYLFLSETTLYLAGEYRSGDIVSTGRPTLQLLDIASVFVKDDVFVATQLYDYRTKGNTSIVTLGYNIPFADNNAFDISWRNVVATPSAMPAFAVTNGAYRVNQLSVNLLVGFKEGN